MKNANRLGMLLFRATTLAIGMGGAQPSPPPPQMITIVSARRSLIVFVLATHVALISWSATRHAPTYDEVAWLPAGLSHWRLGRFDLARVNPPLVRMVAALPVTLVAHEFDLSRYPAVPHGRPEFQFGIDFMRANGQRSFWLYTIGRWACIPLSRNRSQPGVAGV